MSTPRPPANAPRGPRRWLHHLGIRRVPPETSATWEIEHHLSELVDRLVAEGMQPADAEREATRRFGDRARYVPTMRRLARRQLTRERLMYTWDAVRQSVTSVARTARRYPGYTAGVVITLGLGLGANATMYGIVDRLLLQPPKHIVQPERVRRVFLTRPHPVTGMTTSQDEFTPPDYEDLEAQRTMSVAGYDAGGFSIVGAGAGATQAGTLRASAEYFPLLGVRPHMGRFFSDEEVTPGPPTAAVLSYEFWRRAFGADPDILGRVIEVADDRVPVIGVLPQGFTGVDLRPIDMVLPLFTNFEGDEECLRSRGCYFIHIVARLNDGVGVVTAQAEATRLHQNGRRDQVEAGRWPPEASITLSPLRTARAGPELSAESRVAAWLMGVSVVVLLIACMNVANLLFARMTRQRRELAVRLALGVSRRRLVSHAVLESTLLALTGGVVALGIARWGGQIVRTTLLPDVSFPDSAVGLRVIVFTLMVAVLAGLSAGFGPALQGSRVDIGADLTASGRGSTAKRSRTRDLLTAGQAALSVVLLVGAGLFTRSLSELWGIDLGLDTDRIVVADLEFVGGGLDVASRRDVYALAARRVAQLPGVEAVAGTASPFQTGLAISLRVPELDSLPRFPAGGPYLFAVTPGYFETAGLAITRGRPFAESDGPDRSPVALVSETMARAVWPGQDPIGRCLMVGNGPERCTTVVGVAEDAARNGFTDGAYMGYYLPVAQAVSVQPMGQSIGAPHALYIRGTDPEAIAAAVTPILRTLTPEVRWARVWPMRDSLAGQARSWTLGATMFVAFGLLAVSLAAIGLYAILAFEVAQRTRELGIRVALGAQRARLLRGVLYRGGQVGAAGILAGLVVSYAVAPLAQDLLFEVSPRDPRVLSGVALLLATVSVAASIIPALRATRVDPVTAIRSD